MTPFPSIYSAPTPSLHPPLSLIQDAPSRPILTILRYDSLTPHHSTLSHLLPKSIVGLRLFTKSSFVPTILGGNLLTRYAPFLTASCWTCDIPLLVLRMEPASLILSWSLNLRGGAKSRAVKVPDLRRRCGLGIGARSSNAETRGVCGLTEGE